MSRKITIGIVYGDFSGKMHRIRLKGRAGDDAIRELERAVFKLTGRDVTDIGREEGESIFVLSPVRGDKDALGWDYLHLPARVSFKELREIVGPRDFEVRADESGFGGDGLFDGFFLWSLSDVIDFGRDALEAYGAVDVMRRLGRAMRRRALRERRRDADLWLHEGGAVPERLRDAVESQGSWSDKHIKRYFEMDRSEGKKLMKACGYRWSREHRAYFRPDDVNAVN
ncbi:hypothetical protein ACIGEP_06105 [Microbacterium sp. NPDC077663]|uniref:hypothetical protein n=1 Tax=Microbacterium sp. NPDC077663 TaxID=3364189 RepID=UPI0037C916E0